MAKLVVFRGDDVEREVHVGSETIRIGRDARNDVVLDDKAVTRFHAEVGRDGSTFYISDLNSRNGVWINKQRITRKTPLELGVPVTIGAYELTLEDDLGTSELGGALPTDDPTAVHTAERSGHGRSSSSSTRGKATASATGSAADAVMRRPAVFWSAIAVGTMMLCFVTYISVRRLTRPGPVQEVAINTPPPATVPDPSPTPPPPTTPVKEEIVAGYLEAAQFAIEDKNYEAAADDIDAALELDPTNQDLLVKKKQVQDLAAAPPPAPRPPKPTPPPPEVVVEVQGITRRPNESPADYSARVQRIQTNMRNGMASLDKEDFARALTSFQAVDRDHKGYMNVDQLITDATTKQKRAVETAISNGQANESANNLVNAIKWYEQALRVDPTSAAAQGRLAGIADRRTKLGLQALERADVFRKRNLVAKALEAYQEAADLLPSTNEKKAEAQQWVEKLKQ